MHRIAFRLLAVIAVSLLMSSVSAQSTPNYGAYEALSVQEFDLLAAPGRTGAHLSPDGTRFAHFERGILCLYALTDGTWTQERCIESQAFDFSPEDMFWSPDGRYLTLPTFQEALVYFRDTDIQIIDVETGAVRNLTDDGIFRGPFDHPAGDLDIAPRWLDADTLLFIRYPGNPLASRDAPFSEKFSQPLLMQIDVPANGGTSEPQIVAILPDEGLYRFYLLTIDPARSYAAVNLDRIPDGGGTDLLRIPLDGGDIAPFAAEGTDYGLIGQIVYSLDGQYLLISVAGETGDYISRVVSTVSGSAFEIDPNFPGDEEGVSVMGAGWSPEGSAVAYVVRSVRDPGQSGLYLTDTPGKPGRLIMQGDFYGTTCCQRMPIAWAANDVLMLGRGSAPGVLLVQLGVSGS
ncbi:hypothetical protein FBR02_09085 [Anaerolineae bacterium CFX9]|nr:hypothetical protein [Anaerolineae bacterium CFX9]